MLEIIKKVEKLIDSIPTGEIRNQLTEVNILLHEQQELQKKKIPLSSYEVKSNLTRVKLAENLILQLDKHHDGRNSWLLNYGTSEEANHKRYKKGIKFFQDTQSAETIKS